MWQIKKNQNVQLLGKASVVFCLNKKYVLPTFCQTSDNAVRKNRIRFENLTVLKIFDEKIDKPGGGADLCLLD